MKIAAIEKKLVHKLIEECTEINNEVKLASISCTLYIVLLSIVFTINVGLGTYFVYYK